MALFLMILRKMINNKWLELSLLFGLVLSVALASSMPIYTNAILQRLLVQELKQLQLTNSQYPGIYWLSAQLPSGEASSRSKVSETDVFMSEAVHWFDLPVQAYVRERATQRYSLTPALTNKADPGKQRSADMTAIEGMEQHIRLIDGRMPAAEPLDGVYEALVVPDALTELGMVLGHEFALGVPQGEAPVYVKPVGVFERSDYQDLFWYNIPSSYKNSFLIDFALFERDFTDSGKLNVQSSYWYTALDYTQMTLASATDFQRADRMIQKHMDERYEAHNKNAPAMRTLGTYYVKETSLRQLLWSLNVPVMLMLAFYLYMVANLITERQKTEIAVLRSRGASRLQIMGSYVAEGLVLGALAFLIGPYLGLVLTRMLGASSGFLEFVQRAKVDVSLNGDAYLYALIAVAVSLIMTLIPVALAMRVSIVGHKQQSARQGTTSFWHKYLLDFALIGIALYGLYTYRTRMEDLQSLGLKSGDLRIDPLLFLIPALFILGTGLLVLRLYPWLMRLIYQAGRRWWPPSLYATIIQVSRSTLQYQVIMVFLIVTIATGLYGASATRTINANTMDKIRYAAGADITLDIRWENDAPPVILYSLMQEEEEAASSGQNEGEAEKEPPRRIQYAEPSFLPFTQLPGVQSAAKVFVQPQAELEKGKTTETVELMGIDTKAFGETAWMRDKLLDHHIRDYLNLIAPRPSAVLISRSLADEHGIQPGETISIGWKGVEKASFTVYGVIDYWPSWNPNPGAAGSVTVTSKDGNATKVRKPMLVIGHLTYIQNNLGLEPYQIWLKLKPDAPSQAVYKAVTDQGFQIDELQDAKQEQIRALKDPFQLAINGVMTLGFLISVSICFFGFLLYWILSLHARTLQYGIFRAMGISLPQLVGMLVGEQIMISGAAIAIGMMTGSLTSQLFVPLFEMSFDPRAQVPPFQVMFDPRDQTRLYAIVTVMMTLGLSVIAVIVSRIRIHQAVKLGED
ncbi:ABC transporter permease [Paenibacillus puerhi]|uniref:ABC transporter permease n=1 Tax=Paenibacillus puerhi TaxID=2692622 RepID=UPI00135C2923|nr:ABC transporter permease [Paenibacillus puerhi]